MEDDTQHPAHKEVEAEVEVGMLPWTNTWRKMTERMHMLKHSGGDLDAPGLYGVEMNVSFS